MADEDDKRVEEQRRASDRLIDRQGLRPAREAFERGTEQLGRQLRQSFRGRGRLAAGATGMGEVLVRSQALITRVYRQLGETVASSSGGTVTEALRQLARYLGWVRGPSTILEDPVTHARIAQMRGQEAARLAVRTFGGLASGAGMRVRLALLRSDLAGLRINDAIYLAQETVEDDWWRVERIVKTETSRAFNAARTDGIAALQAELTGVMKRWTERVSDTGRPLDRKVGKDSLVLHGQVTPPGGRFVMPADPRAPAKMIGRSWAQPPNRPNDRAVLIPWSEGWGQSAWILREGTRVPLR